jgi:hypothetical protein
MKIFPGDVFCVTYDKDDPIPSTKFEKFSAFCIRNAEIIIDYDGHAVYTHTGIITNSYGDTFEALNIYRGRNIYRDLGGRKVIIGRHKDMTPQKFHDYFPFFYRQYAGRYYPAWKLPLFLLFPRILKWLPGDPVCSELASKLLYEMHCKYIDHWRGLTPSYIADMIRRWSCFEKVNEGRIPTTNLQPTN